MLLNFKESISYPFHDPVMTDRAFITKPKVMLWSFVSAAIIGGLCIFFFSFLGIFLQLKGIGPGALSELGALFGPVLLLMINFIMIVSAASTLDSSFASFSKLAAIDLGIGKTVKVGRITMIIVAIAGSIPIFFDPAILSATTVSGTMVIGLTPVFLFWRWSAPTISFYSSVLAGIAIGVCFALDLFPNNLVFTEGPYNKLLWVNIYGVLLCILFYFLPFLFIKNKTIESVE